MKPLNVVLANSDLVSADSLANQLRSYFRSIAVVGDASEIRRMVPKNRAEVLIADLDTCGLEMLRELHREFGGTAIICTHRLADETLWAQALEAGAVDCCHPSDVRGIVLAANGGKLLTHGHVA